MSLLAGGRLGPYEILAPLGSGGMGEVYKARDTKLNRDVALKVLPEAFALDSDRLARFKREAHVLASLNHPNIATIHGFEETDGTQALVLELVEGSTLADRIAQGPVPLDEALPIARQISCALEAAHEHGIIHRDLKPANIKVREDGAVKVLDFGLAKALEPVAIGVDASQSPTITSPAMTGMGVILGTAAYMSPEQAKGRPADKRSDMWAFGCVLYEMLTGKRAFAGDDVSDTLANVLKAPPNWEALPQETPAPIRWLLRRCLMKDPKGRIGDASIARIEIDDVEGNQHVDVAPARNAWRERTVWIASSVFLLGAVLYVGSAKPPDPALETKVQLSVNPPDKATLVGARNTTVPVPVFALSPDGQALVFSAATAGARPSLWLRPIGEVTARALPGTDDAQHPFWSPDGGWIAFFAEGKLKKLPAAGGPVQVVLDGVPDPRGGSWGRDDTILVGGGGTPLLRVPSSGGGVGATVTTLDASRQEASHRWPMWMPDGRHFLFTVRSSSVEHTGVYVSSLEGKPQRLSIPSDGSIGFAAPGYVLFLVGDTLIGQRLDTNRFELSGQPIPIAERVGNSTTGFGSFSASGVGVLAYAGTLSRIGRLTWFDRGGNQLGGIASEGDYTDVRLSPDDQRLAVSLVDPKTGNPDIWLTDLTRGSTARFTFGPRLNSAPIWSPDGSRIVFRTTRKGGQVELYQKSSASGGSEVPVLLEEGLRAADPHSTNIMISDWSPDARHLLYSLSTTPRTDLWLLPLIGDRKPVRFLVTQSDNMHGTFSPDGRLVAYSSNESGRFEVYVQTFPLTDRKWPISTRGGYEPRWRADGREIYYLSDDRKLMAVAVGAGPSFDVPKELFQTRVLAEQVTPLRTHYSPNRDGTRFLVITQSSDTPPTPITVVLNWQAALGARERP